jgi:phage gp36-like protein
MAYATVADLLLRYDSRRIGDLVSDNDTRVTNLADNVVVLEALKDASSMIDSSCRVANRYSQNDLNNLTSEAANLRKRLCCDLAFGYLIQRRGYGAAELETMAPGYINALDYLEKLRQGERVFDTTTHPDAGNTHRTVVSKDISFLATEADRYFGSRKTDRRLFE